MKCLKQFHKKERFTKFNKKRFIKMWRTMKAEVGDRQTHLMPGIDVVSIKQLMNRYEARSITVKQMKRRKK